ncbi:hypothetical protein ACFQVC_03775 [Streptomyces monticola]|uniref:DUF2795 domain-containing protein n=1 Tax=Streptomyces monticola TaxID=2666263 RepID=A0ABW2JCR3_9ACTN
MQRGSDRLNVHRDDEMKHELQGLLRSGHPTRTEEWNDPEPAADDDPRPVSAAEPPGRPLGPVATTAYELARLLGRGGFPATAAQAAWTLREKHAPDQLVDRVRSLTGDTVYPTAEELARAVTAADQEAEQEA